MTSESGKTRRRYGPQFKAMVLAQCDEPGMSVAQVPVNVFLQDWARGLRIGRELCHQFSRGDKAIPVAEFGVELDDTAREGSVRNADLHRSLVALGSMLVGQTSE